MRKRLLAAALAVLTLTGLTGCDGAAGRIRFGAAGLGGMYQAFGDAYAKILEEAEGLEPLEVKTTAGSAANIRLISDDYIQLTIAQNDMVNDAYAGTGIFEGESRENYSAVAGLFTEACQLVVRANSSIERVEDLQGKTVSIGEVESGSEQSAREILEAYGLSERLVDMKQMNYAEEAEALKNGEIDALFCTAGVQTMVLEELARQCEVRFLNIDGEGARRFLSAYEGYSPCVIPAGTYTGQDEDVTTVGVEAVLLASDKLSAEKVRQLTEVLFTEKQKLQYALPLDWTLDETSATEAISIPFHPGAAAYYKECGIDVSQKEGNK